jgi:hypothetical protein
MKTAAIIAIVLFLAATAAPRVLAGPPAPYCSTYLDCAAIAGPQYVYAQCLPNGDPSAPYPNQCYCNPGLAGGYDAATGTATPCHVPPGATAFQTTAIRNNRLGPYGYVGVAPGQCVATAVNADCNCAWYASCGVPSGHIIGTCSPP